MLTRLEVDGFKNLRSVAIDFGPFTCIAGENGAGKSNVFDAIEFGRQARASITFVRYEVDIGREAAAAMNRSTD